jgi:DNA repair protein RadA/Sms
VDVVCQFDGERHSRLRLLRAVKNRYGQTDEVGCFDLTDDGIEGLADPSGLFTSRTSQPVSGTCISVTMEGRRPLLAEVQSLLTTSMGSQPRRTVSGLDSSRVGMLLAVLQQRAGLRLDADDSYVATVGGARLTEPAMDLAVALAIASAKINRPVHHKMVAFGEVGLAGEVRPVPGINQRIQEAARLGFTHALVPLSPAGPGTIPPNFTVKQIEHIAEATELLLHL